MTKETEPNHIPPQPEETPSVPPGEKPKLPAVFSKNNLSIWPDGKKPADEDEALEHCKIVFEPLWDALINGKYIGDSEFHPTKDKTKGNKPADPTGNG